MQRRLALALLTLSALAAAQTPHPPSGAPMSMPAATGGTGAMPMEGGATSGELEQRSGRAFDRAYLSMMIAHHQAAVDMSALLLPRMRDPQVREWAEQVISGQQGEIREMTAMLADFGLGGLDPAMTASMTREMAPMLSAVKRAPNPEEAFVTQMLEHHALGIRMATLALLRSDNNLIRLGAQNIVRVQAQQMYQYRGWQPKS